MNNESLRGKTLLVVHAGNEGKRFVFHKLKKLGLRVICLNSEKVPALQQYVDHWIIAEPTNARESVEGVKIFLRTHPKVKIGGAVTFWEESVLVTSKITDTFDWIGIPYNIAKTTKNKFLFREFCEKNGIPSPKHKMFSGIKSISRIENHLKYPMVMKPVYGAASFFVVKVENRKDIEDTYEYIEESIRSNWLAKEWENMDLLVEEYIDGDEVDIDIVLQNGKIKFYTISDNFNKNRDKFFLDAGQAIPSGLPETDQQKLVNMAEETLEKLGIQNSIIHFEAKISGGVAYPIEVNMRMGGDYIYSYIKGAWGVNFVEEAAHIALGYHIKIEKPAAPLKYIVGWDLQPDFSGILVEFNVDEKLKLKKYLEEIRIHKELGDPVLHPPEGYDSLGWLTVSGENLLDAQDNLREALEFIQYKIVESDSQSSLGKTSRQTSLSAAFIKKDKLLEAAKIEKVRLHSIHDQRKLHVGIAANLSGYTSGINDDELKGVAYNIEKKLREHGYLTSLFDFNNLSQTFNELYFSDIDLIFNISEGVNNGDRLKPQGAGILETLRIPYTGTDSLNLALCRDKIRVKKFLSYHDIPTPKWDYAYSLNDKINPDLKFPLIVKPSNTDNSIGITNSSVVRNKKELLKQLEYVIGELGRAALVEEYIDGDEYYISILGSHHDDLKVLPLAKTSFKNIAKRKWKIVTEEAKHLRNGKRQVFVKAPVKMANKKLESLITEIALDTYKIMHCQDYGSVEVRVDKDDNPYVLELNPNPILNPDAPIVKSAKLTGLSYAGLLEEIISLAIRRYQNRNAVII